MKTYTRVLRKMEEEDFRAITSHNNHKASIRTAEQNAQALADKKKHYREKWERFASAAETEAQKKCCERMLNHIERLTKV